MLVMIILFGSFHIDSSTDTSPEGSQRSGLGGLDDEFAEFPVGVGA